MKKVVLILVALIAGMGSVPQDTVAQSEPAMCKPVIKVEGAKSISEIPGIEVTRGKIRTLKGFEIVTRKRDGRAYGELRGLKKNGRMSIVAVLTCNCSPPPDPYTAGGCEFTPPDEDGIASCLGYAGCTNEQCQFRVTVPPQVNLLEFQTSF